MGYSDNFDPDAVDIGFVHLFGANEHMPEDTWALCEGQDLSIDQNPALFAKLGYTFGGDKGYFKLPNFKPQNSLDPTFVDVLSSDFITDRFGIKIKESKS